MKKLFVVCLLVLTAVQGFAASGDLALFSHIYDNTETHENQYALIQTVAGMELSDAGEFYAGALGRLVREYSSISSATEKEAADNQAILLATLLGQEKHTAAAGDLWQVVIIFPNALVKAEALASLGKMRAMAYFPQVIQRLNDLNLRPARDRLSGEREAYGAIIALEKYGEKDGYLPVYFASTGWYTDRIKSQARKSLAVISADPTDWMIESIRNPGSSIEVRLAALEAVNAAGVPAESKSKAALAAFDESWIMAIPNQQARGQIGTIRKLAMRMFRENGCSDAAVYPRLKQSYDQFAVSTRRDSDRDECFDAITTLAVLGTEDAANLLAGFLMNLNILRLSGSFEQRERDLIMAIIPALGATKQAAGRNSLVTVAANTEFTNAITNLARKALEQIP